MGYYVRVLGMQDPDINVDKLVVALRSKELTAQFSIDEDDIEENWREMQVADKNGNTIFQIERNAVADGSMGKEELEEFKEFIQDYKPASAVQWLTSYFEKVKVIYAFQLLNAIYGDNNFDILDIVKETIWEHTGGILQADHEGFTNEAGMHILWQFDEDAMGEWDCAVINNAGEWDNFRMELGDTQQRDAFQKGEIPKAAVRI